MRGKASEKECERTILLVIILAKVKLLIIIVIILLSTPLGKVALLLLLVCKRPAKTSGQLSALQRRRSTVSHSLAKANGNSLNTAMAPTTS